MLDPLKIKEIQFASYQQALYQAWFATTLEQTKSIFSIASMGIGLSLTLIVNKDLKSVDTWAPVWLFFAITAFALSVVFCIFVFRVNGDFVRELTKAPEYEDSSEGFAEEDDAKSAKVEGLLGRMDLMSRICFVLGLIFLVLSAVAQIWLVSKTA